HACPGARHQAVEGPQVIGHVVPSLRSDVGMVARVLRTSSIFAVWLFAYLLSYFYRSANAVIASDLRADVGLSNEQLGFMTSLFYLAFAVTQLPLGAALDRWGSRTVTSSLMLVGAF